ncbi:glutathione S-transferase [Vibrio breoganii]|uniref:glutathione S-transferase n=1 Tax=Vibrio breoganii TaxID=553239 RepID=UPI000C83E19C|nr:glutathione S-transferase [Vibrio breoganii]PMG92999.1 glutathione S-transferase [Vibrio breoganii]
MPILYSLQHCPYAMRARTALIKANQQVLIRAIKLDNKPKEMLLVSPKGSVPVLVLTKNETGAAVVLEESLEIMLWALRQDDPDNLLRREDPQALPWMTSFITEFEHTFIPLFDAYSCAKRYHNDNLQECREACEEYVSSLEARLSKHPYLFSENESLVDIALFPFMRKFAKVDKQRFRQSPYPNLRKWLNDYLQSSLFSMVMQQHELWLDNRKDCYLARNRAI